MIKQIINAVLREDLQLDDQKLLKYIFICICTSKYSHLEKDMTSLVMTDKQPTRLLSQTLQDVWFWVFSHLCLCQITKTKFESTFQTSKSFEKFSCSVQYPKETIMSILTPCPLSIWIFNCLCNLGFSFTYFFYVWENV